MNDIAEIKLSSKDVFPDSGNIYRGMGYPGNEAPAAIQDITEKILLDSKQYININGGYRLFLDESISFGNGNFSLEKNIFETDKIIGKQLKQSTAICFLVATLGNKFDEWVKNYFDAGDPLKGYIADTIGSETVERAGDFIEAEIASKLKELNLRCTNRYSPGYCGWNVSEQHKFFSLLPRNFCGIELSESALMKPIKSISAVIGIGEKCEKKEYHCSLCDLQDCYKRNREIVNKNN